MERQKIRFASGDTECAAWHYPGTNGGCVVMTGGFAVTKEPGTDLFARRFNEAGFGVLAFDYRHLGESGGQPRQVQRDPGAARRLAGRDRLRPGRCPESTRPGSRSGASPPRRPRVPRRGARPGPGRGDRPDAERRRPGGLTQRGAAPEAARHAPLHRPGHRRRRRRPGRPSAEAGAAHRGAGNRRAAHHAGQPGRRPGARPGRQVPGLAAGGRRPFGPPPWLSTGRDGTRPGSGARCWSWSATRTSRRWPRPPSARPAGRRAAELVRMPGGHYEPFLGGHERAVEAELSFLRRHLLGEPAASRPAATADSAGRPA